LSGFDIGTQHTLAAECGLGWGNLQWPGVLDLFSEPEISWFYFFVGFESAIHTMRKELLSSGFYKNFDVKKWLNMNSKPDNKCETHNDIILLSEIITNSIYWQEI
jgi:hypothetical protein